MERAWATKLYAMVRVCRLEDKFQELVLSFCCKFRGWTDLGPLACIELASYLQLSHLPIFKPLAERAPELDEWGELG